MTVTIQIGNSDDKLSQERWAEFFSATDAVVRECATNVYFSGASYTTAKWQNAAWVFDVDPKSKPWLVRELSSICVRFRQDSIAWTQGDTEFIGAEK